MKCFMFFNNLRIRTPPTFTHASSAKHCIVIDRRTGLVVLLHFVEQVSTGATINLISDGLLKRLKTFQFSLLQ